MNAAHKDFGESDKPVADRLKALARQREAVLALPPEEALAQILSAPQPAALVHALAAEDLLRLIHEIGLQDSLPLLALASDKQKEFILDLEVWRKARLNLPAVTRWFALLFEADAPRFLRWILEEKRSFLELYLFRNIEVRVREHDQDPSDFGDDFVTEDEVYYVRFVDPVAGAGLDKPARDFRDAFLERLLKRLARHGHHTYQAVLLESASLLPAEVEEEALRLRNVRLAERGFLPFDEAIGIYQSLDPADLERRPAKVLISKSKADRYLTIPRFSSAVLLEEESPFTRSLAQVDSEDLLYGLQAEFAGLCNRIIAADQEGVRSRESLRAIVRKACGYLNIGLTQIAGTAPTSQSIARTVKLIKTCPLEDLFRVGYGQALQLKWRAERWRTASWFARAGLALSFWDEEWVGVLGGLLIKKPLYFDNFKSGVLYREFQDMADIQATARILDVIIAFDDLLGAIAPSISSLRHHFLTYKNVLLTLWARSHLEVANGADPHCRLEPLAIEAFREFWDQLWEDGPGPRRIRMAMRTAFLNWLARQSGLEEFKISERMGTYLEDLFNEIESEYGAVAREDLDPRHIRLFVLERKPKT